VIHRAQPASAEQLREGIGIDLIALVPRPRCPAPITDDDPIDERRQQIVQLLRLGAFLERDMDRPPHPADVAPQV